jgi:hypothetical protein
MKKLFLVNGKRWFAKTYWNTYNSVDIYIIEDGEQKHLAYLPKTYWYWDYFLQRAVEWLFTNGYIEKIDHWNGFSSYDKTKYNIIDTVQDVTRQKDL